MSVQDDAQRFEPTTLEDWSTWLATHHADTRGVWLVSARRANSSAFDYEAGVVEALRYGWVDSTRRTLDAERSMMWFAPRRPGSVWTRRNKDRVTRLEDEGRLEPAGAAAVAAARSNGMWTLMDDVEALVIPGDLAAALAARQGARDRWDSFPASSRKQALAWIVLAKRSETRAARVTEVAESSARGERPRG